MDEKQIFDNEYLRINRLSLKILGLWPYQSSHVKICIRTFVLCAIHTMMIPQIIRAYEEWGNDFEIVIENISGFFYFECAIAKYVTNIFSEPQLEYLYEKISMDWQELTDKGEQITLRKSASFGRLVTIGYSIYMYIAGIGFAILPGLVPTLLNVIMPLNESRQKILCYYAEYYVDQHVYYYQLLLHTIVCVMCTIIILATVDTVYVSCVQHSIGLFHVVGYRLKKAFDLSQNKNYKSKDVEAEIHNYVISSIAVHNKSIEFVDLLQSSYTNCFFLTTTATLFGLSLATVLLMMNTDNIPNLLRILIVWFVVVFNLLFACLAGQQIIDSSSDLFHSVYSCGWYNFPLKTQRLLSFMLMRCSVPCRFTAGPLLVMNLESYGSIIKSSMSYCMFVITMA